MKEDDKTINALYDLMEKRIDQLEFMFSSTNKSIEKIEGKLDDIAKPIVEAKKDIEFLQSGLKNHECKTKDKFTNVWEIGVRQNKEEILKTVNERIDKKAMSERLALYGAIILALAAFIKGVIL
jgi:flagellar biosynthesis chaperone FliJ